MKAAVDSGFQGKGITLHCKVLSVLVRSTALTPPKTVLLHLYPPLGTVHRRKCSGGHQGKLDHAAQPWCHRDLEMPWGQMNSPAPLPARDWASRVKSSVSSTFPEVSERVGYPKAFLWKADFLLSPRGAMEASSPPFLQSHSDNNDVQRTVTALWK